ncbi:MAG: hypothetical protein K2N54_02890 [Helicobacter sp.]|nr:hypothetical protein [Helicobacter sp.]
MSERETLMKIVRENNQWALQVSLDDSHIKENVDSSGRKYLAWQARYKTHEAPSIRQINWDMQDVIDTIVKCKKCQIYTADNLVACLKQIKQQGTFQQECYIPKNRENSSYWVEAYREGDSIIPYMCFAASVLKDKNGMEWNRNDKVAYFFLDGEERFIFLEVFSVFALFDEYKDYGNTTQKQHNRDFIHRTWQLLLAE